MSVTTTKSPTGDNIKSKCICPICDAIIRDAVGRRAGQDSVECSGQCAGYVHRHCAGLSKAAFQRVSKSTQPFYCSQCRLDNQEKEINSLRDLIGSLNREIKRLEVELRSAGL